eukprot:CAMPEP_0197659732 /NCGR_PEP_ID=MMETSP1338-20131121/48853_1 /TAXON_ID=43686 ORGANISM="Pelagodinium beii, Strain RCC1491" /NCGR_SAMPLE_ID=MMETSP1338 /ASSEMBLY_ACC=CAM_ASM_000754 /LENGTH=244 /DNA_ID=CAMNT_0043236795 /DNA_START=70 /DNA_END=801 /DNA_ORIENTATION=+
MPGKIVPPSAMMDDEVKPPTPAWSEEGTSKDLPSKQDGLKEKLNARRSFKVESQARLFGFTDPEEIKRNIKASMVGEEIEYDVFDCYWETGIFQRIAKHYIFENLTLGVISLNAVYIAIDTDWNKADPLTSTGTRDLQDSPAFFQAMEHLFCIYFTAEWIIRFCAFKNKCDCLWDAWFVFDSIMVILMVGETWVLLIVMQAMGMTGGSPFGNASILRLFRLLRLARLLRMLRSLPELMILIKGM